MYALSGSSSDTSVSTASMVAVSSNSEADLANKYTVRLNTWQRPLALKRGVRRMLACPEVAQVVVVWTDPADPPSAAELAGSKKAALGSNNKGDGVAGGRVVVERHTINGLNQRFLPLATSSPRTDGILSIDDDLMPTCDGKSEKVDLRAPATATTTMAAAATKHP